MTAAPLAHLGHWYSSALYVAPVVIVAVGLWLMERREARLDSAENPEPVPTPPAPPPA